MVQLDFFKTEEECRIDQLSDSFEKLRLSTEKVRRGMFARHGELSKQINDVDARLALLEKYICQSDDSKIIAM